MFSPVHQFTFVTRQGPLRANRSCVDAWSTSAIPALRGRVLVPISVTTRGSRFRCNVAMRMVQPYARYVCAPLLYLFSLAVTWFRTATGCCSTHMRTMPQFTTPNCGLSRGATHIRPRHALYIQTAVSVLHERAINLSNTRGLARCSCAMNVWPP